MVKGLTKAACVLLVAVASGGGAPADAARVAPGSAALTDTARGAPGSAALTDTARVAPGGGAARPLAVKDVHPAGFDNSWVSDLNGPGEAIITATTVVGSEIQPPRAFVWRAGKVTALRPPPGGIGALARDINERGEVAGFCQSAAIDVRPCLWRQGRPLALATIDGRGQGIALAINDRGAIVGDNQTLTGGTRAFLWRHGVVTDLGGARSATGLNERTQVIGVHYTRGGRRGFVWDRGRLADLGTLGGTESVPADITEGGQIVGTSTVAAGVSHAFLWQRGRLTDLGPGGAVGADEHGQVVGWITGGGWFTWRNGVRKEFAGTVSGITAPGRIAGITQGRVFLRRDGRTVLGDPAAAVTAVNRRDQLAGWINVGSAQHAAVWN
ncbi:hypothetical protein [Actinoplanes sp. NPDC089786]|uniref:hypothetical protein n=1 Tax=Actinoplanes sp. NPDC089786 TaxID=3155185 RepID=UPI0034120AEA